MAASRFSVLKIYDDEDEKAAKRAASLKAAAAAGKTKGAGKKSDADEKAKVALKAQRKQQLKQERAELVQLAFGGGSGTGNKKKAKPVVVEQPKKNAGEWKEWEKKDQDYVSMTYQKEIEQALLASKIVYEEESLCIPDQPSAGEKKSTKAGKKTTMSLREFNNMEKVNGEKAKVVPEPNNGEDFFDELEKETMQVVSKEKGKKNRPKGPRKVPEPPRAEDEGPRLAQLREELETLATQAEQLKDENTKLKDELRNVKTRNKRLCDILVQGEMKEKAEILVQVEKLTKVKDELTSEVDKLSIQLQQERSKVSALMDAKKTAVHKKA